GLRAVRVPDRAGPVEKDLDAAIIWAHVEETPTMPAVLRPDLPPEIDDVFRRVLSKQPGDRYQSCREFVDAARVALGSLGPETQSSLAYGAPARGPRAGAPPGSQPGAPPDTYSWSSVAGQPHAAEPLDPVAPGNIGARSPALAGQ